MKHRLPQLVLAAACLSALPSLGCFRSTTRVHVPRVVGPAPDSPQHAVDLLKWCWEHRAASDYGGLFAGDYGFVFAPRDSAGSPIRHHELSREEELTAATNLFTKGTATLPAARRIALVFDPTLIERPDSRPGHDPGWHREVATQFNLAVDTSVNDYRITGVVRFHLVRGDSALLPQELVDRGAARDSGRWYVERWEEESGSLGATLPGKQASWGQLKLLYLGAAASSAARAHDAGPVPTDRERWKQRF